MENNFMILPSQIIMQQAVDEIQKCNDQTSQFGLVLSQSDAQELALTRSEALSSHGRIEFGGGIINKLILAFCDSPYLMQNNYAATLNELIDTFYYFKNESLDSLSDDALIALMKEYFDNNCRGSIELLQDRELEKIARNIRYNVEDFKNLQEEYQYEEDYENEEYDMDEEDYE